MEAEQEKTWHSRSQAKPKPDPDHQLPETTAGALSSLALKREVVSAERRTTSARFDTWPAKTRHTRVRHQAKALEEKERETFSGKLGYHLLVPAVHATVHARSEEVMKKLFVAGAVLAAAVYFREKLLNLAHSIIPKLPPGDPRYESFGDAVRLRELN